VELFGVVPVGLALDGGGVNAPNNLLRVDCFSFLAGGVFGLSLALRVRFWVVDSIARACTVFAGWGERGGWQ
jgi:hypothetical protein